MVGPNNALCCLDKILKQGRCGLGSLIRSGFTMWFIKINSYKKDPLSQNCADTGRSKPPQCLRLNFEDDVIPSSVE